MLFACCKKYVVMGKVWLIRQITPLFAAITTCIIRKPPHTITISRNTIKKILNKGNFNANKAIIKKMHNNKDKLVLI